MALRQVGFFKASSSLLIETSVVTFRENIVQVSSLAGSCQHVTLAPIPTAIFAAFVRVFAAYMTTSAEQRRVRPEHTRGLRYILKRFAPIWIDILPAIRHWSQQRKRVVGKLNVSMHALTLGFKQRFCGFEPAR
jgi:hypothetical protein